MVLITEDGTGGDPPVFKVQQNGTIGTGSGALQERDSPSETDETENRVDDDFNGFIYDDDDDDVYQEFEELDLSDLQDNRSLASDDSFYPRDDSLFGRPPTPDSPEPLTFFRACSNNNAIIVKIMIRQGVTEAEVKEVDKNNRSGLILACYNGYVDVVIALAQCPFIDVNWQDNEGNTALITAAQAGLDIERRNCHGFTALMKAAMQGRAECVRALMMSGADIEARDFGRKLTSREWALFTCRYETVRTMERLMAQPCAEQFCESYRLEWPQLEELVVQAQEPRSCWERLSDCARCCTFNRNKRVNAADDGALDYMVRFTTALNGPVLATGCHTVCPRSPPCLGKRRPAVQDILRQQRANELRSLASAPERLATYKRLFQNSRVLLVPKKKERRASLQPQMLQDMAVASQLALRRTSLLPLHMLRRSSVRPGLVVPKVMLCKAPAPAHPPEKKPRRHRDDTQLQIPKWKYKEVKSEKKRADDNKLRFPSSPRR
ncbi:ankyrin repeat domain-containing protein 33B isoform X2 [Sardina pilchardus]|uniref:ankyrin repeat domain-containing protein 33B isoform X2 n=1 Tax=Sardina pilchardus TaxID=27697 RepID=UPI002E131DD6